MTFLCAGRKVIASYVIEGFTEAKRKTNELKASGEFQRDFVLKLHESIIVFWRSNAAIKHDDEFSFNSSKQVERATKQMQILLDCWVKLKTLGKLNPDGSGCSRQFMLLPHPFQRNFLLSLFFINLHLTTCWVPLRHESFCWNNFSSPLSQLKTASPQFNNFHGFPKLQPSSSWLSLVVFYCN